MLTIDGAQGEGGGQILRTSLALALVTGRPFRMVNIRAGRKKPGLLHQHLTAVQAVTRIGRAKVEGVAIGSKELTFAPTDIVPGEYRFAVGTAGSATLVLQAVLPALMTAASPSVLTLEGGTHNPYAPPFGFLQKSFLPFINRMGPKVDAELERPGFYPAGGGRFMVTIAPAESLACLDLLEQGEITQQRATAIVSALPRHIAERELAVVERKLEWPREWMAIEEVADPRGPGNVVAIEIQSQHVTEVFTAFGTRGIRAEEVANQAVKAACRYLTADVPVGEHLADQLLLPLALAGGGSFKTLAPSNHTRTNLEVIGRFLDVEITAEECDGQAWLFRVVPL